MNPQYHSLELVALALFALFIPGLCIVASAVRVGVEKLIERIRRRKP